MKIKESIIESKNKLYNFLTAPQVVKKTLYLSILTFIPALIIGILVAQLDPDGFNLVDNFISDLGSYNHTPMPYFLDYGSMITAVLLVPMTFYLEKVLAPFPKNIDEIKNSRRMRFRLASAGLFWQLLGLIGFFGIGLFSEDRTTPLRLHSVFSVIVFIALGIGALFYGLVIVFYNTIIPKILGVYQIFIPLTIAILYLSTLWIPLEWILLFSLFAWLIPTSVILIKYINKEPESK